LATGTSGIGVYGEATNVGSVTNYGGRFKAQGSSGTGVSGEATGTSGTGVSGFAVNNGDVTNWGGQFKAFGKWGLGVYGYASGESGKGVYGFASKTGAVTNYGGYFKAQGKWGQGVHGEATGRDGQGVHGEATGAYGQGVRGEATGEYGNGVLGVSSQHHAVTGQTYSTTGGYAGAFYSPSNNGNGIYVRGKIVKTGTVSFVEPHPTDETKAIVYIGLEGGEAGTYSRGTATLQGGRAWIDLPEHFQLVTSTEGLTVQVTPNGSCNGLYVASRSNSHIEVRELGNGTSEVSFDWIIHGVRTGHENYDPITSDPAIIGPLNEAVNPPEPMGSQ
jgi:hypothetical protein